MIKMRINRILLVSTAHPKNCQKRPNSKWFILALSSVWYGVSQKEVYKRFGWLIFLIVRHQNSVTTSFVSVASCSVSWYFPRNGSAGLCKHWKDFQADMWMSLCYRRRGEWRMDSKKILGNLFFYGHLNFLDIYCKVCNAVIHSFKV